LPSAFINNCISHHVLVSMPDAAAYIPGSKKIKNKITKE
jgi:hypothetical protein